MSETEKFACPHCGSTEYLTELNAYDVYVANGGQLLLQNRELVCDEFKLFCRDCWKRAPKEFEESAVM